MFSYRLFDYLDAQVYKNPNAIALVHREKRDWIQTSFQEYQFKSNLVSKTFIELGINKGDMIGTISMNRSEWNFLDMGALQIGAIHVAIHPASSVNDILYILNQTELTYFFCGNRILYKLLLPHVSKLSFIKGIYCIDEGENIISWNSILADSLTECNINEIQHRKDKIKPEDIATILYTSGTGGNTKGVVHTHASFGAFAEYLTDNYYLTNGDKAMSVLSVSHSFERLHYYFYLKQGMAVYYADNSSTLIEQIKEVQPNSVVCVPLLIENFYKALTEKYILANDKNAIAAIEYTQHFEYKNKEQFYLTDEYKNHESFYIIWNNELGGAFRQIITGAAMIPEYLVNFFWSIKVPLFECYGSTEALLHTVNHQRFKYKAGTVGRPLAYAEMKISDENEIWMKSKSIMKGYYKLSKLTQSVLDKDGWYHSGDSGFIDEDGFLHITGRTNTIFKLSNGKYLNPELLEQQLLASHLIKNIFITQDENIDLIAVVRPNTSDILEEEDKNSIIGFINTIYNAKVMDSEKIKKILFTFENWTIETDYYTPTMKLKRKILVNKYLPLYSKAVTIK